MSVTKVPEKNTVFFVWINNYAGLLLKTPSKTLLIDPVEIKARNFPQVDAILISHEHYDHLDQRLVAELQKATSCLVIADSTSFRSLRNILPPEKLREIQTGEQTKIGEVVIKAEKAKHPAATPVTFIITSEDGVKIWHTSDSAPYPEMATIAQKEQLDVVFCTVGIAPGAAAETGFEIAWLTKPKVAVPYHSNTVVNQKKFAETLKRELPKTTCLIPEINKIYQISKGEKKT